ncbi:MAG: methylenetetrahydrofolate reductase [Azospirillaceae bacterium]|nr:methylenetetrahydrofolate reductase [Azospirillaceae bacterium]
MTDAPIEAGLLCSYSLEATVKDIPALVAAGGAIPRGTVISIPYLHDQPAESRVAAAVALRRLGYDPMPHIAARRVRSADELRAFLAAVRDAAQVDRVLVIAGDCDVAEGPYPDALSVIRGDLLAGHGIRTVGISGYPEGHPKIAAPALARAMADKLAVLAAQGQAAEIATQFAFDADPVVTWLEDLRGGGVTAPVRLGVPGPASVKTLLRFAALCGVGASAKVLAKYGISLTQLLNKAGPDRLMDTLSARLTPAHGVVHAHFYPFGGVERTAAWIEAYAAKAGLKRAC